MWEVRHDAGRFVVQHSRTLAVLKQKKRAREMTARDRLWGDRNAAQRAANEANRLEETKRGEIVGSGR